jgi:hypothetical protein
MDWHFVIFSVFIFCFFSFLPCPPFVYNHAIFGHYIWKWRSGGLPHCILRQKKNNGRDFFWRGSLFSNSSFGKWWIQHGSNGGAPGEPRALRFLQCLSLFCRPSTSSHMHRPWGRQSPLLQFYTMLYLETQNDVLKQNIICIHLIHLGFLLREFPKLRIFNLIKCFIKV